MRNLTAWIPVVLFLAILIVLALAVRARGDDGLLDKVKALEARNAAVAQKKTIPPDQDKHDPAGDPFAPKNATKECGCSGASDCNCTVSGCRCAACAAKVSAPAVEPMILASDGRYYPRSAWGAAGPWGATGTYTFEAQYGTATGGCANGSCSAGGGAGLLRRRR